MKKKILAGLTVLALVVLALNGNNLFSSVEEDGFNLGLEIHVTMYHRDPAGNLLAKSHHAGNFTYYGMNYTKYKLAGYNDPTWANNATFIGVSNSTATPIKTWTAIPAEITTDGLARAAGSYTDTGVGTWNISKTFSCTGTNSSQLAGLYIQSSGSNLICADTYALVTTNNGDSLQVVWSITVS